MKGGYELGEEALRQIAEVIRRDRGSLYPENRPSRSRRRLPAFAGSGVIVRNDSLQTIPAFGVMRITGMVTVEDEEVFTVAQSNATFQRRVLVNGENEITHTSGTATYGAGRFCDLQTPVLYDTADGTPAYDQWWGPYPSSWKLRRHCYGFQITGGANTDLTTAFAIQHVVQNVLGKTDGGGTVSVWKGNAAADTTANITSVENPFASVVSDRWVRVMWDAETPRLAAAECP